MQFRLCLTRTAARSLAMLSTAMLVLGWPLHAQAPWQPNAGLNGQHAPAQNAYPAPQYGFPPQQAQPQPGQTAYPDQSQPYPEQGSIADPTQGYAPPQPAQPPLATEQLEQLVAPIALYPDTLVAQVLAAATYPAQVVDADHWRQAQGYAPPEEIVAGANAQSWDPSVKALTAFPQILAEMDRNLRWTIALGNAYYNQPQDLLDVVQVMRQRAQAAGTLVGSPQLAVGYDQGYIEVAPADPQVVYLPAYDPWTVYGQPVEPYRGFSLSSALGSFFNPGAGSGAIRFGMGIAMQAFNRSGFGLLGWGLNWLTHSILFHNSGYVSHSTTVADWGLPHGGPRAVYAGTAEAFHAARLPGNGYPPQPGYARPAQLAGSNGYRAPAPASEYARSYGQSRANPYAAGRPATQFARNYPILGNTYARPPQQFSQSRPVPTYGSGFYGAARGANPLPSRPALAYNAPPAFRAPAYQSGAYGARQEFSASREFDGGKQAKPAGFRDFGGGSGREPKPPKAPKPMKMDRHSFGGHAEKSGHPNGHGGGHRR